MDIKLKGLLIAVCQMNVVPYRPDLNAAYIIKEIEAAAKRGVDIIAFPEMCVSGYILGDEFEDDSFVMDVFLVWNNAIIEETKKYPNLAVIFGSLGVNDDKGEDGRIKKYNSAYIVQNGTVDLKAKTLQPNYRIFDDDRHFYSVRKELLSGLCDGGKRQADDFLRECYSPATIISKIGNIKVGVILCEDMWHDDYAVFNPTKYLVGNGAEIIFNLSCSPWSWQKNRKRHAVVKELLAESPVPFVYVNNTGIQNNGKNIIIFDGSSTIYNASGEKTFCATAYRDGTFDYALGEKDPSADIVDPEDTAQIYQALRCAVKEFFKTWPEEKRKVVIGLSGGIDSAVTAAFYVNILGPENVTAINMPSRYNSAETQSIAKTIADNLGIRYEIIPIQEIVDTIAKATGVEFDSLAYENIQAKVRMEILAAKAQKVGGVFTANGNKVEIAFGYGTLYADIAGFLALIGDLVKREVYQLGDYLNREIYGRKVIPKECFEIAPSAELATNQKDPFDYGNLSRRGYHDEMVRALTEFRRNPEWFLENYLDGTLENILKLEPETLARLFKTNIEFIDDLERCWRMYRTAVFKRVQSPPIPIVSKRAFGYDLRESILSTHYTLKYEELKKKILAGK